METALNIALYMFSFFFAIAVFWIICGEWILDRMKLHAWTKWANQGKGKNDKT
jgi:hypothetical protein